MNIQEQISFLTRGCVDIVNLEGLQKSWKAVKN